MTLLLFINHLQILFSILPTCHFHMKIWRIGPYFRFYLLTSIQWKYLVIFWIIFVRLVLHTSTHMFNQKAKPCSIIGLILYSISLLKICWLDLKISKCVIFSHLQTKTQLYSYITLFENSDSKFLFLVFTFYFKLIRLEFSIRNRFLLPQINSHHSILCKWLRSVWKSFLWFISLFRLFIWNKCNLNHFHLPTIKIHIFK